MTLSCRALWGLSLWLAQIQTPRSAEWAPQRELCGIKLAGRQAAAVHGEIAPIRADTPHLNHDLRDDGPPSDAEASPFHMVQWTWEGFCCFRTYSSLDYEAELGN